jgi:hypothetical protein
MSSVFEIVIRSKHLSLSMVGTPTVRENTLGNNGCGGGNGGGAAASAWVMVTSQDATQYGRAAKEFGPVSSTSVWSPHLTRHHSIWSFDQKGQHRGEQRCMCSTQTKRSWRDTSPPKKRPPRRTTRRSDGAGGRISSGSTSRIPNGGALPPPSTSK